MKRLTQAVYAKHRGVSRQMISKLVKDGTIKLIHGLIDPVDADRRIADNKDLSRGGKQAPSTETFSEARARKERALASLREIEALEKKGTLVDAESVRYELAKAFTVCKSRLRQIPPSLSGEIFHTARSAKSEREGQALIFSALQKAIDEALTELSGTKI